MPRINNAVTFGMSLYITKSRLEQADAKSIRTLNVSLEFFEQYFVRSRELGCSGMQHSG